MGERRLLFRPNLHLDPDAMDDVEHGAPVVTTDLPPEFAGASEMQMSDADRSFVVVRESSSVPE